MPRAYPGGGNELPGRWPGWPGGADDGDGAGADGCVGAAAEPAAAAPACGGAALRPSSNKLADPGGFGEPDALTAASICSIRAHAVATVMLSKLPEVSCFTISSISASVKLWFDTYLRVVPCTPAKALAELAVLLVVASLAAAAVEVASAAA